LGIYFFGGVIALFAFAAIIAYVLNPLVDNIESKRRMKRGVAVALVMVAMVLVIGLFLVILMPMIYDQLRSLTDNIPAYTQNITAQIQSIEAYLKSIVPQYIYDSVANNLSSTSFGIPISVDWIFKIPVILLDGVLAMVLITYFLLDGRKLILGLVRLFSNKNQEIIERVLYNSDKIVWQYLKVKFVISLITSVVLGIGFAIFGIKYALLLAVLAFILNFIPYFGAIIAGVFAVLVALATIGWPVCLWVAIFILVVQQIEGNIITPKFQGESIGLHPVIVLFALLASSAVWGPLGMFIAVPLAGITKVFFYEFQQIYKKLD
jgi:predicted PurR-regulated permease PerM